MNKTIYIRDEDVSIWDRAKDLAGDKLAPVIVDGLKRFIAEKEAELAQAKGFERIEVSFNDANENDLPKRKAFVGRWVFHPGEPFVVEDDDVPVEYKSAVAVTQRGNVVFYTWRYDTQNDRVYNYRFVVYPSIEAAIVSGKHDHAARAAFEKIGVPLEELDI